jgi:hypothetical protein
MSFDASHLGEPGTRIKMAACPMAPLSMLAKIRNFSAIEGGPVDPLGLQETDSPNVADLHRHFKVELWTKGRSLDTAHAVIGLRKPAPYSQRL